MNGSLYERELSNILSGNAEAIKKFSKRLDVGSAYAMNQLVSRPFFVTRSAGSLGADLIAIRNGISLIIEVKSSAKSMIKFTDASGQRQDQARRLKELCERAGLFYIYAYRLKNGEGEPWKLFAMISNPWGNLRMIYDRLAKVGETKNGNYFLKWEEGTPLSRFLDYLNKVA
ncbi:MAG: hypothetical protein QW812_00400 [Thermoplasmataceae archaeon]